MTDLELNYCPATELLEKFRKGDVKPSEVLEAHRKRYLEVNGHVNAFTFPHFDEAMKAAEESDKLYLDRKNRPLEGIPIALKDEHGKDHEFGFEEWKITSGSHFLDGLLGRLHTNQAQYAPYDLSDKLRAAGAVLHAQTTVPEMYVLGVTWSNRWGTTRNPWNTRYAVGGSSGGSGAALAAGMTTLATGSDMGGSIRIPAAFNGLYGYKPPGNPNSKMPQGSDGPMARTFDDMVLMQNVLSTGSLRPTPDIRGFSIAYDMDQGWAEVDPEIRKNTLAALDVLKKRAPVEEIHLGLNYEEIYQGLLKALLSGPFGLIMIGLAQEADAQKRGNEITTYALAVAKAAEKMYGDATTIATTIREAQEVADKTKHVLEKVFSQGFRALIMPTLASNRIRADFDPTKHLVNINGISVPANLGWALTPVFNLCYQYPVVSVPTGIASNGVPTGMQIVAKPGDEGAAFQIAAAFSSDTAGSRLFHGNAFPKFQSVEPATNFRRIGPAGERREKVTPFDDTEAAISLGKPMTRIIIRAGYIIDSIQVFYGDVPFPIHGGNGGGVADISLDPGDYITTVSGYHGVWLGGRYILRLELNTKGGKRYGPYAGLGDVRERKPFKLSVNSNEKVVAFFGHATFAPRVPGGYLSSIGITAQVI